MIRENFNTGAPWEAIVGYSRAVRIGKHIEVSGTVSVKDGKPYGVGDAYAQTRCILEIIGQALSYYDCDYNAVIRTRIYVRDISKNWEAIGKAHGEVFAEIRPATSMVEVSALIAPEYLVEIEATAVIE